MELQLDPGGLTAAEYLAVKATAGWGNLPPEDQVELALERSLYQLAVRDGDWAVGMARLIGDGVFYWHIQDVIVRPEYQGCGAGRMIMEHLLHYIWEHSPPCGSTAGLVSAVGKEGFYAKLGFHPRPREGRGAAMDLRIEARLEPDIMEIDRMTTI